ncbi:MAG TPA: sulfurtransferase complex subunit TusC [Burkholderiaceae bacterium]|nr:sulfurtransferase complex subunit TusC [Burkholderiaceae bacterium]
MAEQAQGKKAGPKKFALVTRHAPHGTVYALEALEVVLIAATFDQDVSLVFLDDGVYALAKGQKTTGIEVKNFSPTFRALDDYDVNKLYVERESLQARGITADSLLVPVEVLDAKQIGELIAQQDVVLSF